jgi:predicted HAD superfamily Cof-like phosphohydrolase
MIVTNHARKRMKERAGVGKKACQRLAENAVERGINRTQLTGSVRRFLDKLYFSHEDCSDIIVYAGKVFVFVKSILVTVMNLPSKYIRDVR